MATRISFSTTYPDRMGLLKGKFTRFPEKILKGLDPDAKNIQIDLFIEDLVMGGYGFDMREYHECHPKTTTIRSNYDYWKSKEGQLIQPFFWSGKPYRSKQVVFCPEVRLAKVSNIDIKSFPYKEIEVEGFMQQSLNESEKFTQDEGFDHPDHFWMWFNQDFNGALLELESVEG